ncbi:MAG: HD domain-containing protein [Clostridia bacterium]|nr:HD domain-containing protein [Clostridia bacterium]
MKNIIKFVKNELSKDNSGHGLQHALRVYNNAKKINNKEKGNEKIVLTAALIHDTVDKKLFENFENRIEHVKQFLCENNYTLEEINEIVYIISNISWNNGQNSDLNSLNAKIVRDADRLDAIGAIGIIRTIEYGNSKQRNFYDDENILLNDGKYKFNKITNSTLSHFYEKLLLLKDKLHTKTALNMAQKRHDFMQLFLKEFYDEI